MKKARLLSTVAAALLFGVGAVSAQGMSKDTPNARPQHSKARRRKRSRRR